MRGVETRTGTIDSHAEWEYWLFFARLNNISKEKEP